MTDELDGLLGRVEDPALRADLRAHIDRIRAKRNFGLIFESHLPERVRLPEHPVRAGAKVAFRDKASSATYQVVRARGGKATIRLIRHPDGSKLSADEADAAHDEEHAIDTLVVIADFGEPIYPGLRRLGSVERGGAKPAHVVIKGENHHVLEALQFTHAGKVDCIYIDPPYNTGARDWKYDNNYVDDTDAYRHSKWLAFMERRLRLAKKLMNPERSALIVTIDEKEYLRLGLLLEQVFAGCRVQMVTVTVNPRAGVARPDAFTRVEEYAFYVMVGSASIEAAAISGDARSTTSQAPIWFSLMRTGSNSARAARPNLFYPIWVQPDGKLHSVGEPIPVDADRSLVPPPVDGLEAVWPLRPSGAENTWQLGAAAVRLAFADGTARIRQTSGRFTVIYLRRAEKRRIEAGEIEVLGRDPAGALKLRHKENAVRSTRPRTVWMSSAHDAGLYGSSLLRALVPNRAFPFPKSLYAVEDAIRFIVGSNPDGVVLDFFAGSGTTSHAVARLNRQDGGRRQSILVTNNEVSAVEAGSLRQQGLHPGDQEWEALGIFEQVTRPRLTAAVTGLTPEGEPVRGDYKFSDEFPMADGLEENVAFEELVYLDPDDVELHLAFEAIAPLLWLRAGAIGPVIDDCLDQTGRPKPYEWTESYGVLFNPDRWRSFADSLPITATTVFIVTDSSATFAGVAGELPDHLDVIRLYENYLTTFRINEGLV